MNVGTELVLFLFPALLLDLKEQWRWYIHAVAGTLFLLMVEVDVWVAAAHSFAALALLE